MISGCDTVFQLLQLDQWTNWKHNANLFLYFLSSPNYQACKLNLASESEANSSRWVHYQRHGCSVKITVEDVPASKKFSTFPYCLQQCLQCLRNENDKEVHSSENYGDRPLEYMQETAG